MNQRVFAESPSLARQENNDDLEDVIDMAASIHNRKVINATKNTPTYNIIDIHSFSYVSDGKVLNATLAFPSRINEAELKSSSASLKYGMLVDVDNNIDTGWYGIDYKTGIEWDITQKKWIRIFEENFKNGGVHARDDEDYSVSFDNQSYAQFSVDLDKMGFPNPYKIVFYAEIKDNNSTYNMDFTPWVRIPPPEVSISVSPNPLSLIQGGSEQVQLNVKSGTGFRQPYVTLWIDNSQIDESQ
jgi:hypothetical protein